MKCKTCDKTIDQSNQLLYGVQEVTSSGKSEFYYFCSEQHAQSFMVEKKDRKTK